MTGGGNSKTLALHVIETDRHRLPRTGDGNHHAGIVGRFSGRGVRDGEKDLSARRAALDAKDKGVGRGRLGPDVIGYGCS